MAKPLSEQQILIAKRRKARHYGVQALYQWKMAGAALNQIEAEFRTDYDFTKVDGEYFHAIMHDIPAQVDVLDDLVSKNLTDREMHEVGPVEISLLRLGSWELKERLDVPVSVVLNESVSLAKKFGPVESHKFINAVLDKLADELRAEEKQAQQKK
ncbi:MAG: transcription antitermination factor NusB [Sinobacterium sp.]|nr:transcription antitermination factor NusB [Sinobacterium sp.]